MGSIPVGMRNVNLHREMRIQFVNELKQVITPSYIGSSSRSFVYYPNNNQYQKQKGIIFYFNSQHVQSVPVTYTDSNGNSTSVQLVGAVLAQEYYIQSMNTKFAQNNIPIQWKKGATGYEIDSDKVFTLTCSALDS